MILPSLRLDKIVASILASTDCSGDNPKSTVRDKHAALATEDDGCCGSSGCGRFSISDIVHVRSLPGKLREVAELYTPAEPAPADA
jgi:hypothetical protein